MQIFQIRHGRGTDAYYLHQFRKDNVFEAAAFYCKYRMFSYNICCNIAHSVNKSTCRGYMHWNIFKVSRNLFWNFKITINYSHVHTRSDSSESVIRALQVPLLTQHTQEKYIHALGGIRTRIPSNLATADLGLTPYGHWICCLCIEFPLNLRQREFHFQIDAPYYSARSAVVKQWTNAPVKNRKKSLQISKDVSSRKFPLFRL